MKLVKEIPGKLNIPSTPFPKSSSYELPKQQLPVKEKIRRTKMNELIIIFSVSLKKVGLKLTWLIIKTWSDISHDP